MHADQQRRIPAWSAATVRNQAGESFAVKTETGQLPSTRRHTAFHQPEAKQTSAVERGDSLTTAE